MPRSVKQNEQMRTTTQTALLNSAMTLFAQNGYTSTTTRSIAKEAGISTGLMYHYFDNKESLLRAVFDNCMAILSEAINSAYEQSAPEERLANLLRAMFEMLAREEAFWSLFYMLRSQPAIMRVLGDDFRKWTEQLRSLFEVELQQLGRADSEMDALMLYSFIEGTIQQFLLNPTTYPLDRMVERIVVQFSKQSTD